MLLHRCHVHVVSAWFVGSHDSHRDRGERVEHAGVALGVAYTVGRTLLPSGTRLRTIVFTLGTTAFMLGQIIRGNREDFTVLPVTLSVLLVVCSVALTAAPVPMLVERFDPDRKRRPGRLAQGVVALGMTGFAVFAVTGIMIAYAP